MTPASTREPRVVVIGAGVAGIATAHALQRAGFTEWVVLEKGEDVGGVWYWNRYPGLTCDVPSQIYQFSFAPKPDWDRIWATGTQIQQYHRDVVDELGIGDRIRVGVEVTAAEYDDVAGTWTVRCSDGEELICDFLVCATGVLHNPAYPDIPGLDDFAGPVVHTARWDEDLVTDGRRVAVIGTGSTGVQVVSALAGGARSVMHFVRSPQWVLWAPMGLPQPRCVGRLLRRLPRLHRRMHQVLLWGSGILADVTTTPSWRRRAVQRYARASLRTQVRNPRMRAELTPDYEPLCKRQVVSGSYYRALKKRNTRLITARIAGVTGSGVRTDDGRHHEVDVIVLATGFHAHDYMRPMVIRGRGGRLLDDAWSGGPRAYRMTAIPGFPNLFTVLGPNSPTGSISLQFSAELTARYITQWLDLYRAGTFDTAEVTDSATDRFNAQVEDAIGPTVWNTGCRSWYRTEAGRIDLWPFDRATMEEMLGRPEPCDFTMRTRPE